MKRNKRTMAISAGLLVAVMAGGMATAQTQAVVAAKSWYDNIAFKGDLRYRNETIMDDSKVDANKENYTRNRDRIRVRLGAEAKCNDALKVGIEMSTGEGDPISGNQTIGSGFSKKDFNLNLAYADYSFLGDSPHELHIVAGKMKNPFMTWNDDLVWDGDASPEGAALKGQATYDVVTLFANGGYFWLKERTDASDTMLYGGQAAVKIQPVDALTLTVGASYYMFDEIAGEDVIDWENKNNAYGNSTGKGSVSGSTTNKSWKNDYTPIVPFVELCTWIPGMKIPYVNPNNTLAVTVFGQYLTNPEADNHNSGYMAGVSLGKAKLPQSLELGYSFVKLEKDATLGMLTDSDRWGGGTDGQGHKVYGKYQIMKNLQAGVSYFKDDKGIADASKTKDYDRLQVDLVASF